MRALTTPHRRRRLRQTRFLIAAIASRGLVGALAFLMALPPAPAAEVLPKHVSPETLRAVRLGLDYLARTQNRDGSWSSGQDGQAYPVAMTALAGMAFLANGSTPTRGPYAPQVAGAVDYLARATNASGLLTGANQDSGRPMHGHGFALMFLASSYGMIHQPDLRKRVKTAIDKGVGLTARGQSPYGGWTYVPGAGDEGSVTVTQVQALRAARNAGFVVPPATIEEAVKYIERCSEPGGGIRYAMFTGGGPRFPISAAAVATLYNAGEFDSPVAERCLEYVWERCKSQKQWNIGEGHDYYAHLYMAQAFYMAGDKYWDQYYPWARDALLKLQNRNDGSWNGDGVGPVYGSSIALVVLQLPYRFLPVYQR